MKDLYLLSGLGADKRVFSYLDLNGYRIHHIEWISPEKKESLPGYARRLTSQIKSPRPVLIGVSFGGLVATEIGKWIETERIILISSLKTKYDLPLLTRIMGPLRIHMVVPIGKLSKSPITARLFGVSAASEKELLRRILDESDPRFLRWGMDQLVNWKNRIPSPNATLIQGTDDRVLPCRHADHLIRGGGHFMIVNRAAEISQLVRSLIESAEG